jgi:ribosome-associated protein
LRVDRIEDDDEDEDEDESFGTANLGYDSNLSKRQRTNIMLSVTTDLSVPLRELRFTFSRSSGPGGQNVNKLNTKATLRWNVRESASLADDVRARFIQRYRNRLTSGGELVLTSQRFRDQGRNVADCLAKLRSMLAEAAVPPVPRKPTKPTRGARVRRRQEKRAQSERKRLRRAPQGKEE